MSQGNSIQRIYCRKNVLEEICMIEISKWMTGIFWHANMFSGSSWLQLNVFDVYSNPQNYKSIVKVEQKQAKW